MPQEYQENLESLKIGDLPHRMNLLNRMLAAVYGIGSWCFGYDRKDRTKVRVLGTTCKQEQMLRTFFDIGGIFQYVYSHRTELRPVFFTDTLGCMWVGEWTNGESSENGAPDFGDLLFVLGPVMYGANTLRNLQKLLEGLHYSKRVTDALLSVLQQLPVVESQTFINLGCMQHFILTGQQISGADCIFQNENATGRTEEDDPRYPDYDQSSQVVEKIIMDLVRSGDVDGARQYHGRRWLGVPIKLDNCTPFREMQDTMLIFAALCSRAAMEGGLPPRLAKHMERYYLSSIESCGSVTALTDLSMTMLLDFTQRVRDAKREPEQSKAIQDCCAYIQVNINKVIDLAELAKEVGYTEYYLTKKFNAEMGMKLSDYIKQKKVERAKLLLATTNKSVQEISDSLQFSSRNYFSAVFTALEGKTPAAYRAENNQRGKVK